MGTSTSQLLQNMEPNVTNERILKILQTMESTNHVVLNQIINKTGRETRDGFLSDIIDVKVIASVNNQIKEYHWIIKSPLQDPSRWVRSKLWIRADEREARFYGDLLPRLKQFADIKNRDTLIPSFCPTPFPDLLVRQNLKPIGYRDAINRNTGLDLYHTAMGIRWLASFHALGYAFIDQCQGEIEDMKKRDPGMNIWKLYSCTYYQDKYRKILTNFKSIRNAGNRLKADGDTSRFKIKTVNHGYACFSNLLFKYGEGKESNFIPVDVRFVDFQLVFYGPAALDLTYFICSSPTAETQKSLPHLLRLYYQEFVTNVSRFGSVFPYTYDDVLDDFYNASFSGLDFAIGPIGMILQEKEDLTAEDEFSAEADDPDITRHFEPVTKQKMQNNRHVKTSNAQYLKRIRDNFNDFVFLDFM